MQYQHHQTNHACRKNIFTTDSRHSGSLGVSTESSHGEHFTFQKTVCYYHNPAQTMGLQINLTILGCLENEIPIVLLFNLITG